MQLLAENPKCHNNKVTNHCNDFRLVLSNQQQAIHSIIQHGNILQYALLSIDDD